MFLVLPSPSSLLGRLISDELQNKLHKFISEQPMSNEDHPLSGFITNLRVGPEVTRMEDEVIEIHHDESFTDLPRQVDFHKVIEKVLEGLRNSTGRRKYQEQYCRNESIDEKMRRYLALPENKAITCDCFWYILCRFFKREEEPESEMILERRMSQNYINLLLSIPDKNDNKLFFQDYFDILSQAVYHSLCMAYPEEMPRFHNEFRTELITLLSKLFSGIDVSKPSQYVNKWKIINSSTLASTKGGENIMSKSLPPVKRSRNMHKREQIGLRYSPIVELFLKNNKYKTKNYIPEFKMRYSKLPTDRLQDELRMKRYQEESNRILRESERQRKEDEEKKKKLEEEIRLIKRETINHHRRLDKRKAEEMERGTHQYANYLVSMLNAGITLTTLGVIRRNDNI